MNHMCLRSFYFKQLKHRKNAVNITTPVSIVLFY